MTFQGNDYNSFFQYPNPNQGLHKKINKDYSSLSQSHYDKCKDVIEQYDDEKVYRVVTIEDTLRNWKVHSCFEPCKQSDTLAEGFTVDERPLCKALVNKTPCLENKSDTNYNQTDSLCSVIKEDKKCASTDVAKFGECGPDLCCGQVTTSLLENKNFAIGKVVETDICW